MSREKSHICLPWWADHSIAWCSLQSCKVCCPVAHLLPDSLLKWISYHWHIGFQKAEGKVWVVSIEGHGRWDCSWCDDVGYNSCHNWKDIHSPLRYMFLSILISCPSVPNFYSSRQYLLCREHVQGIAVGPKLPVCHLSSCMRWHATFHESEASGCQRLYVVHKQAQCGKAVTASSPVGHRQKLAQWWNFINKLSTFQSYINTPSSHASHSVKLQECDIHDLLSFWHIV